MLSIQILFLYIIGLIFFIFGLEEDEQKNSTRNIIYLGMSFFVNVLGYYSSYLNDDYFTLAYLPLAMIALSIILLLYNAFSLIPVPKSWGDEADETED